MKVFTEERPAGPVVALAVMFICNIFDFLNFLFPSIQRLPIPIWDVSFLIVMLYMVFGVNMPRFCLRLLRGRWQ